jgi:hypothetical protein
VSDRHLLAHDVPHILDLLDVCRMDLVAAEHNLVQVGRVDVEVAA